VDWESLLEIGRSRAGNSGNLCGHPLLAIAHRRHDLAVGKRQRPPPTVADGIRVEGIVRRYPREVTDEVLTLDGLRRRRTEIMGVARRRRAHRIAVFGSVARGEARPDSDLDLLVDFEPGTSLLDHVGLFQDLEELLGIEVDVVARSALKPRDEHIRAEAVDL
jgi:hypothetical protein